MIHFIQRSCKTVDIVDHIISLLTGRGEKFSKKKTKETKKNKKARALMKRIISCNEL